MLINQSCSSGSSSLQNTTKTILDLTPDNWLPQNQPVFVLTKLKLAVSVVGVSARLIHPFTIYPLFVKSSSSMSWGKVKRSWSAGGDCCWREEEEAGAAWHGRPPLATWQPATLAKHGSHTPPFPSFSSVCILYINILNCTRRANSISFTKFNKFLGSKWRLPCCLLTRPLEWQTNEARSKNN